MRKLRIVDNSGNVFYVHEDASIERADMPGRSFQWHFVGLHDQRCARLTIKATFADIMRTQKLPDPLYFKNGKCRYTVCDNDHGTIHTWGSPGLRSIAFI